MTLLIEGQFSIRYALRYAFFVPMRHESSDFDRAVCNYDTRFVTRPIPIASLITISVDRAYRERCKPEALSRKVALIVLLVSTRGNNDESTASSELHLNVVLNSVNEKREGDNNRQTSIFAWCSSACSMR